MRTVVAWTSCLDAPIPLAETVWALVDTGEIMAFKLLERYTGQYELPGGRRITHWTKIIGN